MGNYVNKFFSYDNETRNDEMEKKQTRNPSTIEKEIMHTPPVIHKTIPMDPRSVTSGINRTPIEMNSTPVRANKRLSAIPRHLQTKSYLETDIDEVMLHATPTKHFVLKETQTTELQFPDTEDKNTEMILTPINSINTNKVITAIEKEHYNILGLDPRSPAADFDRTPILMPKSAERLRARSQERLHGTGSYDTFSYCEMSSQFNVTEIQALPDLAVCTAKSLKLVNSDCDKYSEPDSSCSSHSSGTETGEKELEDRDEIQTSLEQYNCDDTCEKSIEQKETCINDNDIIQIWRDSLVLDEPEESQINESNDVQVAQKRASQAATEVIITFDDDSIAKDIVSLKLVKSVNDKIKVDTIGKKVFKSDAKIPTDEKKAFNTNDKHGSESAKIRTPLGNRSNKEQMLLTKTPQQMFRNKGMIPKMFQENTPPNQKHVAKSKLSATQWDPDSTVVI